MPESPTESALFRTVSDVVSDLAELFQRELRLAKAEIAANVTQKIQASIWFAVAGVVALVAVLVLVQAIVFGLIAAGIEPHWACLLVAVVLAAGAFGAFMKGRADAAQSLAPERTIHQIRQDIRTTKEQLT